MLAFRLLGYDLEIRWSVLLLVVFVFDIFPPIITVIWFLVAASAILIHELGHAVVATKVGGSVQRIVLYGLGGVTYTKGVPSGWRQFAVSFAGSGTGIVFGLIAYAAIQLGLIDAAQYVSAPWSISFGAVAASGNYLAFAAAAFMWFSIVVGVFNLLPIAGLDGSHMLSEILEKSLPGRGRFHATLIGLLVSAVVGYIMYQRGFTLAPILLIYFALNSLSDLRRA